MPLIQKQFSSSVGRRTFLGLGAKLIITASLGSSLGACSRTHSSEEATRILVPAGLVPRLVARSGFRSSLNSDYRWHASPDGGACFDAGDGGWIYVSNSEAGSNGGVGALRFDTNGTITDSYPVLQGSRNNCSGGETPWGTWLSCEEVDDGLVWECDPFGERDPVALTSMGVCKHESACIDPRTHQVYLTEDIGDGCLYRFTPDAPKINGTTDLSMGTLELATIVDQRIVWVAVPDPLAESQPLRKQVAGSAIFNGGEGIAISGRFIRFTTKGDNGVWEINLADNRIRLMFSLEGQVNAVDDITHTPAGEILIAEDGKQMRVLYFPENKGPPVTFLRLPDHGASEVTGLAFSPDGSRLYFSSQRGSTDSGENGLSFELSGDFSQLDPMAKLIEWRLDHADSAI